MSHVVRFAFAIVAIVLGSGASAQQPGVKAPAAKPAAPAVAPAGKVESKIPYRQRVPGVVKSTELNLQAETTVATHTVTELVAVDPKFDFAKDVQFRHDVWALEFKYIPVRMIWIDLPAQGGRMQRKLVWYMIYSVTNTGELYHPVPENEETWTLQQDKRPVRFIPNFTLEAHQQLEKEAVGGEKVYNDTYLPLAVDAIRAREDRNRQFLAPSEMPAKQIAPGETVWGIATWVDVDPRTVWFSVCIEGLTNAHRWTDDPAKYAEVAAKQAKGGYRAIFQKVLKLNFYRPGDEFTLKEGQIRIGVPRAGERPEQSPSEWLWRRAF